MAEEKDYSEETAKSIDDEISALVEEALKTAKKIITEKKPVMEKVVAALLEKETLEKEAFEDLLV